MTFRAHTSSSCQQTVNCSNENNAYETATSCSGDLSFAATNSNILSSIPPLASQLLLDLSKFIFITSLRVSCMYTWDYIQCTQNVSRVLWTTAQFLWTVHSAPINTYLFNFFSLHVTSKNNLFLLSFLDFSHVSCSVWNYSNIDSFFFFDSAPCSCLSL